MQCGKTLGAGQCKGLVCSSGSVRGAGVFGKPTDQAASHMVHTESHSSQEAFLSHTALSSPFPDRHRRPASAVRRIQMQSTVSDLRMAETLPKLSTDVQAGSPAGTSVLRNTFHRADRARPHHMGLSRESCEDTPSRVLLREDSGTWIGCIRHHNGTRCTAVAARAFQQPTWGPTSGCRSKPLFKACRTCFSPAENGFLFPTDWFRGVAASL